MSTNRKWIDPATAAELLGVSARTLLRWRKQGVGPAWRRLAAGTIRYHHDQILNWVEDQPGFGEVA